MRRFQYENRRTVHGHAFVQRIRLGASPAVGLDQSQNFVQPLRFHPDQQRGIAAPEEPSRRIQACQPMSSRQQCIHDCAGVVTLHDGDHQLGDWVRVVGWRRGAGVVAGSVPGIMVVIPSLAAVRAGATADRKRL